MNIDIIDRPLSFRLAGAVKQHDPSKCYGEEIIALLDQVWAAIRGHQVAHRGINHVLYGANCEVFAGVEIDVDPPEKIGLIGRELTIRKYAYYKHQGPYAKLSEVHPGMASELRRLGLRQGHPVVEVYGHWVDDEAKLETEVIYPIEE